MCPQVFDDGPVVAGLGAVLAGARVEADAGQFQQPGRRGAADQQRAGVEGEADRGVHTEHYGQVCSGCPGESRGGASAHGLPRSQFGHYDRDVRQTNIRVGIMSTLEQLKEVLARLSAERQGQVLDYAQYLAWQEERADWQRFGREQLARAYGDDEPEYTVADLKPRGTHRCRTGTS